MANIRGRAAGSRVFELGYTLLDCVIYWLG